MRMSWNNVIGQNRTKQLLQNSFSKGHVAHAYLFHGDEGIGKDAMAIAFARLINCKKKRTDACGECESCRKVDTLQHPDIHLIFKLPVGRGEGKDDGPLDKLSDEQIKEVRDQIALKAADVYHHITVSKANFIKINSIREIRRAVSMSSYDNGRKVFIVVDAEDMNAEASNSLLKTLEEPPPNTILILTTARKSMLLSTIISRCQSVQFDLLDEQELCDALIRRENVDREQAQIVSRLAQGSYAKAKKLLSRNLLQEQKDAVDFLRLVLSPHKANLISAVDRLASTRDRTLVEEWLKVLQSWVRDALVLKETGESSVQELHHADLKNFLDRFPRADLLGALQSVERQIALVGKNVYLPLILTTLSIDLKRHLSR